MDEQFCQGFNHVERTAASVRRASPAGGARSRYRTQYDEFFEADPSLKIFRRDTGDKDWTPADYPTDAIYKTLLLRGV